MIWEALKLCKALRSKQVIFHIVFVYVYHNWMVIICDITCFELFSVSTTKNWHSGTVVIYHLREIGFYVLNHYWNNFKLKAYSRYVLLSIWKWVCIIREFFNFNACIWTCVRGWCTRAWTTITQEVEWPSRRQTWTL